MQLNLGAFEFNGKSGYLLKPDILTLKERSFDPFSELSIDGIVQVTLTVKVGIDLTILSVLFLALFLIINSKHVTYCNN